MEWKLDIDGVDVLMVKLDELSDRQRRQANAGLKNGGEILKETISKNTPVSDLPKHLTHAKDSVIRSAIKQEGEYRNVKVGYDGAHAWYMWYLEKGTYSKGNPKGIKPRHMVEHSIEESKGAVSEALIEAMQKIMGGF